LAEVVIEPRKSSLRWIPSERRHVFDAATHDRHDHVRRLRIHRLSLEQRLADVGLREVRARVHVRVVDDERREPLVLELQHLESIGIGDVIRGTAIARIPLGVPAVQLVLVIPAAQETSLRVPDENDAARFARIFGDRLLLHRFELLGGDDHRSLGLRRRPPARG
jgi:hypothetical protein